MEAYEQETEVERQDRGMPKYSEKKSVPSSTTIPKRTALGQKLFPI
jgi:hypothetical protein